MAQAGQAAERSAIARLLNPRAVAIAGVSATPGSLAAGVLENLERFGFAGDIHLIHPKWSELFGRPCLASAEMLPDGVDCVVLAIPVAGVLPAVQACAARGVGGVIIFSAGFAELGDEGRRLQEAIAATARAAGMAIEGPNCLGYINHADGIPLTFAPTEPSAFQGPGIAVVSQSGAMASALRAALNGRALNVPFTISTGNEAVTGVEDFIAHLLDDPRTHILALVGEHIRQPARFLALARRARANNTPLVMLHPGRSAAARAAATTHTGAMTGDHDVMRTLCARAGVLLVETLEELVDVCDLLARCRVRPRGGVAVLGESGAFKALMLDCALALGVDLPPPQGEAEAALNAMAPGFIVASNPLDLTAQGLTDPDLYRQAMRLLIANPEVGALLVVIILSSARMAARKMPPVIAALRECTAGTACVFAMLGEDTPIPQALVDEVRAAGIPFFRSPERAMRALARVAGAATAGGGPAAPIPAAPRLPLGIMAEYGAKDVLAKAGLPTPPGCLVRTVEEAQAAAARLGYPLVLKVQSAALSHKSDIGGVVLRIDGPDALALAWARIMYAVQAASPGVRLDGMLVETMSAPGLELIIGARNDPAWGPVVIAGLGGIFAEAIGGVRMMAPDLGVEEIVRELRALKGAALLGPFRGSPPRDVNAVAQAIGTIARFMRAHPEVVELDVNPLMVFEDGKGCVALDALMVCR